MNIQKFLCVLMLGGSVLFSASSFSAEGDGTGGGGGDGVSPGPDAPPGAQDTPGAGLGIGPIAMLDAKVDQLYDWAEETYPQYFPTHQTSIKIEGYYARHYPTTKIYLGAKDNKVYLYGYGDLSSGLQEVGGFGKLVRDSGI